MVIKEILVKRVKNHLHIFLTNKTFFADKVVQLFEEKRNKTKVWFLVYHKALYLTVFQTEKIYFW